MSNSDYEIFKQLRHNKAIEGQRSREENAALYVQAQQKAAQAGLLLKKHTNVHYSLQSQTHGWRLNIYPGNRRLYYDRQHNKPPFLKVEPNWNLLDVVDAAILASNSMDSFEKDIIEKTSPIAIDAHQIEQRAYFLWEEAGRPSCDGKEFWIAAEKEFGKQP